MQLHSPVFFLSGQPNNYSYDHIEPIATGLAFDSTAAFDDADVVLLSVKPLLARSEV